MRQVYLRGVGCLLAAGLLFGVFGCRESDEPRKTATSGGYTTYTVDSQSFSIAVPDDWKAATSEDVFNDDALEEYVNVHPELADGFEKLKDQSSGTRFFGVDADHARNGFATNVNVNAAALPSDMSEEELFDGNVAKLKELFGVDPTVTELDLPAGHARRLHYILQGRPTLAADQ